MGRFAVRQILVPQDHDYDAFFQFTIVLSLFQPPHYQFTQIVQKAVHQFPGSSNLHLDIDLLAPAGFHQNVHDDLFGAFQFRHGKRVQIYQIYDRVFLPF